MKTVLYFLIAFLFYLPFSMKAQLENVIVETYYVSNSNDSADINMIGNGLPIGSITYRIYIDLKQGSKLMQIYGKGDHALKFSSTANFFNNKTDGKSFAYEITRNTLKDNTVGLDSWMTMNQVCKKNISPAKLYNGILKSQDTDGATLLMPNSDGMLANNNPSAGIPLINADGIFAVNSTTTTPNPTQGGDFFGKDNNNDSSIFGALGDTNLFSSNVCSLKDAIGIAGPKPDSNQILIAQLTTTGTLSFELNIEVKDATGKIINYVSSTTRPLTNDTILSPLLKYPAACGCKDPNYLEYSNTFSCSLPGACITPLVLGCTDTNACNYNANANFNVSQLCCYVGYCNDRNIAIVCPAVNNERSIKNGFLLFPNQVDNELNVEFETETTEAVRYEIYNAFGRKIFDVNESVQVGKANRKIDVASFEKGIYLLRLKNGSAVNSQLFIKN
jgi:Secretion system C-terminal sorting domain